MWFRRVFGVNEFAADDDGGSPVGFEIEDREPEKIRINGRIFHVGPFSTPTVGQLFDAAASSRRHLLSVTSLVGETRALHLDPANEGAVFQVASQFNCLEMISPRSTPDDGITIYARDHTQGPASAMACPAALFVRNYAIAVDAGGRLLRGEGNGQTKRAGGHQLNLLARTGIPHRYQNGYAFLSPASAALVLKRDAHRLLRNIMVGVHENTATASRTGHRVTQVFTSALPLAYIDASAGDAPASHPGVKRLARLCLFAAFVSTLCVAELRARETGKRVKCYLTSVGAGAFGNTADSVKGAMTAAFAACSAFNVDAIVVTHGGGAPRRRIVRSPLRPPK